MAIDTTAKQIQPSLDAIKRLIKNNARNNITSKALIKNNFGDDFNRAHSLAFEILYGMKRQCGNPFLSHSLSTALEDYGHATTYSVIEQELYEELIPFSFNVKDERKLITEASMGKADLVKKSLVYQLRKTVKLFEDVSIDDNSIDKIVTADESSVADIIEKANELGIDGLPTSESDMDNLVNRMTTDLIAYDTYDLILTNGREISNERYAIPKILHDCVEDGSGSIYEAERMLKDIIRLFDVKVVLNFNPNEDIPEAEKERKREIAMAEKKQIEERNKQLGEDVAHDVYVLTNKYTLIMNIVEKTIKQRCLQVYSTMLDSVATEIKSRPKKVRGKGERRKLRGRGLKDTFLWYLRNQQIRVRRKSEKHYDSSAYNKNYYTRVRRAIDEIYREAEIEEKDLSNFTLDDLVKKIGIKIVEKEKNDFSNIRETLMTIESSLPKNYRDQYEKYFTDLIEMCDETEEEYPTISRLKRKELTVMRLIKIKGYVKYTDDIVEDAKQRLEAGDPYFDSCIVGKRNDIKDNMETMNLSRSEKIKWTIVKGDIMAEKLQGFYDHLASQDYNPKYLKVFANFIKQHKAAMIQSCELRSQANKLMPSIRYSISIIPYLDQRAEKYREKYNMQRVVVSANFAHQRYQLRNAA